MFKLAIGIDLLWITRDYVSLIPNTAAEVLLEFRPLVIRGAWQAPKASSAGPVAAE